ncbi:unnamed protein product [Adineta ricciae]|uniref:Uncharacterized protein n=1 Tax=Adineta ricciae TaxID=249248 RepID=A0A815EJ11_ADIRI|nr:unnamed protein product [Adineta ricciae]
MLLSDQNGEGKTTFFEWFWNSLNTYLVYISLFIICVGMIPILMILGGIFVLPTVMSVQFSDPSLLTYCHPMLYTYAFSTALIYFGIFIVLLVFIYSCWTAASD